jgi:hypothetical protein
MAFSIFSKVFVDLICQQGHPKGSLRGYAFGLLRRKVTAQDKVNRPASDEGFRGVWQGSDCAGTSSPAANSSAPGRFGAAIATDRYAEVESVGSLVEMTANRLMRELRDWAHSPLLSSEATSGDESGLGGVLGEKGYYETSCEILKQVADRFHYKSRPREKAVRSLFLSGNCRHRMHVSSELSGREAKFFLDREKQSSYHCHKFSGDFPAGAKFHLHANGKGVNCCSHFWGGANEPVAGHDGTRYRKAETGRSDQANESIPRLRSLREVRPVGVISIPSAHGRRRY